jgi:hypothetical protein
MLVVRILFLIAQLPVLHPCHRPVVVDWVLAADGLLAQRW